MSTGISINQIKGDRESTYIIHKSINTSPMKHTAILLYLSIISQVDKTHGQWRCGDQNNGATCADGGFSGWCCSSEGYCGTTDACKFYYCVSSIITIHTCHVVSIHNMHIIIIHISAHYIIHISYALLPSHRCQLIVVIYICNRLWHRMSERM